METPHFPIYMDYSATNPCDPRVVDAMIPWLREHFGNPLLASFGATRAPHWQRKAAVSVCRDPSTGSITSLLKWKLIASPRMVALVNRMGLLAYQRRFIRVAKYQDGPLLAWKS